MSIMNLPYVANVLLGSNGIPHDGCLLGPIPIEYLLDSNRLCAPSINNTYIVLYRDEDTFLVKDRPIFLDEGINLITYIGV